MVFVADSQIERMEANIESIENLRTQPGRAGLRPRQAPVRHPVQQARPAERRAASKSCAELLNPTNVPDFEAVARTGVGVFDTLKAVAKLVLTELKRGS